MRSPTSTLGVAALGALLVSQDPEVKRRNKNSRTSFMRRSEKERLERMAEAETWIAEVRKRKR